MDDEREFETGGRGLFFTPDDVRDGRDGPAESIRPREAWDVLLESLFEVRYTINSTVNEAWAWRDSGHAGLTDPAAYIKALGAAQAARTAAEKALAAVRDLAADAGGGVGED